MNPGIRFLDSDKDDQKRVATPEKALSFGASFLVIGRPLLQAKDPQSLLRSIPILGV
ncbi:MAG: orotidine 5'-phosphate decarboxylase [Deltaproteobacteria bacterium]|nr:MAG: orotidine 5'-phosphate decarboxylase [Deltaproteobacteria bacterium]